MAKIRNTSGYDLVVPALGGRMVPDGAVVDVEDVDVASALLVSEAMWTSVDKASTTTPAVKAAAPGKAE